MKFKLLVFLLLVFSVRVFGQCTLTVNLTASTTSICNGTAAVLTATPSGGQGPYKYAWGTGETTSTITVNKAGITYNVTVTDQTPGCAGVTKSITLTANATPPAPTAADAIACPNSPATLTASGSSGSYQWYDAAVGGKFLSGNASYQTDPIVAKTTYYVETTVNNCTSSRTAVNVFPISGPTVTTGSTCAGSSVTLTASGAGDYKWYDNPSGTGTPLSTTATLTTPSLFTTTKYYVVGITAGCISLPTVATATVITAPAAPTAPGVSTCSSAVATLHASGPANAVFDWFDVPTGGTSLISSPDYTTPTLTSTKTYYVQATVGDCIGSRTAVTVTINPIPADPVLTDVTGCFGSPIIINLPAPADGTYNWYATANSFAPFTTGNSYTITSLTAPTTYYIEAVSAGGCISNARKPINILVNPAPGAPTATDVTICANSVATLTATGPAGATFNWYNVASGGTPLPNPATDPATFITPALTATATYYVQATINGCSGARTPVTVNVNPLPAAPTATTPPPVCAGSSVTLTAAGTGVSIEWYDAPTGGTMVSNNNPFVPTLSATTTYYVQTTDANGCSSPRKAVTVTVNSLPPDPTITGITSICAGTNAKLTATSAGATTIYWYDDATTTTRLFTGANGSIYTTVTLSNTKTYYVSASNSTCESLRTPVTVTVLSGNQFSYASGTYCKLGGVNPVAILHVTGGTFSASGGLAVNPTNGSINLATAAIGKYTVTYTNGCAITNRTINIVTNPDAAFSYSPVTYCQGTGVPKPTYTNPTGSAGVFTSNPAGLVFVDPNAGIIDMTASTPGTYTVTNTIDGIVGCTTAQASNTVTIAPAAIVNAGPNQVVATGTPVQLAGSISGGTTTGVWSGGTGSFSSTTALKAIYTPGPGETSATLALTSDDPGAPCSISSDIVTISFNPQPSPPTVKATPATLPVCAGTQVTLAATAVAGSTFKWYDSATGNNLLFTGANYPVAPTVTTTYYVQTTVAGVSSTRTPFQVTVNPLPDAPVVDPVPPVCPGSQATLIASGSSGSYSWYTVSTGGTAFAPNITTPLVTGILTANTTYYVESVSNTGCISATRTKVDIIVNPVPNVISQLIDNVCSGTALNYAITADLPNTTFIYTRKAVNNISNAAVTDVPATTITETLMNSSATPVKVIYSITPTLNGCAGKPVNYVVTVYPTPVVTSDTTAAPVCSGKSPAPNSPVYTIKFNTGNSTIATWSRDAVAGISNQPVSGQISNSIRETLFNNTAAPVDVIYNFTYNTANCQGSNFKLKVTVNPTVIITSTPTGTACGGVAQDYTITSTVPSAIYSWSRAKVDGISNGAVSGNISNIINEALINTTTKPVTINYFINTVTNGCQDIPFVYQVIVYPQPPTPLANSNSPVCTGKSITLNTPTIVAGGVYSWTGPNGFTSSLQNPTIDNATIANAGTYTLSILSNSCSSIASTVDVAIDALPVANAGPDQTVCQLATAVQLDGSVTGGTTTGKWSVTSGSGVLTDPANLKGIYNPSAADVAAGSITLTLASTSPDNCDISTDDVVIQFHPLPGTDAGPDQAVCTQATIVPLAGKILMAGDGVWLTSGTGTFSPSTAQANGGASPAYIPSAADITGGTIKLVLKANNTDPCYFPTDTIVLTFLPPPTVSAGDTKFVLKGNTVVLTPKVSDPNVHYLWTPNTLMDNDTLKNPTVTGNVDQVYTLTVTDSRGCIATSSVTVKVAPPIVIPNTFTPNGDGINDFWDIQGLIAYTTADVNIYDRNGQRVFHSIGYGTPWNGTYNNKPLPFGTYYYVIDPKFFYKTFSGYLTIVK